MEQMINDFFIKAFELILQNRLPSCQTQSSQLSRQNETNNFNFQLKFNSDVTFKDLLPSQCSINNDSKLLAVEFFLTHRVKQTKFLVEQWVFDINEIFDNKIEHTIDSTPSLYKKLSVLLRTISLLTVTLPLYQKYIKDRNGSIGQTYKLEYSIGSMKNNLSNWHSDVRNEHELSEFIGPEFVIPGHTFTFKLNYTKSFKFLHKLQEPSEPVRSGVKYDEFPFSPLENVLVIPDENCVKDLTLVRKTCSDTHFNKKIKGINIASIVDSPPSDSNFHEEEDFENCGAVQNIPINIQLKAQKSRIDATCNRLKPRRSFDVRSHETNRGLENSRLRIKTLESERLAELDVYIYENEEDEFTEVLSWQDMSMRNKGSTEPDESGTELDEHEVFRKVSEDYEKNKRRLSSTTRPMEKIIERNEDDRVAEILASIEGLKNLAWALDCGRVSLNCRDSSSDEVTSSHTKRGLKFMTMQEPVSTNQCFRDSFAELDELKNLYIEIKRQEPIN